MLLQLEEGKNKEAVLAKKLQDSEDCVIRLEKVSLKCVGHGGPHLI